MEMNELDQLKSENAKLKKFFRDVAHLTINHDVLSDSAVVYPSRLGPVLEDVDPQWWTHVRFEP